MYIIDLFSDTEIPTGAINGLNKDFTVDHVADPVASFEVFLDDVFQVLNVDYTVDQKVITFTVAPASGKVVYANYRYIDTEALYETLANWSEIVDDDGNQPDDNADVTGDNQGDIDGSNIINGENWSDDTAADAAQVTADGKVVTFIQASTPTAEGVGDLWIDSDDKNKLYRWNGSAWVAVDNTDISQAITDAAGAQATADGKITTFYQISAPTAEGVGDMWIDTDDNNKPYRWNGSVWVAVDNPVADWSKIVDDNGNLPADNATENNGNLADLDVITANEIVAGTITGVEIVGTTLSGIFADLGSITAGSISVVDGANTIGFTPNGINAIFSGPTGSPTFKVTPAGLLISTAGTIGGFTITATTLSGGNIVLDAGNNLLNIQKGGDIRLDQDLNEQSEIIWYDVDGGVNRYKMYAEVNNGDLVIAPVTNNYQRLLLGLSGSAFNTIILDAVDEINFNATDIFVAGGMQPDGDNTRSLGTAFTRWSDVRSVLINGADIGFASGWKFREFPASKEDIGKPDEWFKENANLGIQLLDENDKLIAVFHENGTLYVESVKSLDKLLINN